MKLYNSIGPNPRFVRLFAELKGIPLELQEVDIIAGENRQQDFLKLNPAGTTPVLETGSGDLVSETTAICEYLEALHPTPALIGQEPFSQAVTRMWWRRLDLMVVQPMTHGFRAAEGLDLFKNRVVCFVESADELKQQVVDGWRWFEKYSPGSRYLLGDQVSVVDLLAYCFAEFGEQVGQPVPADCKRLHVWMQTMLTQFRK
ncbi:glutathione S-transferase family protein [Halopseudomonas sp. SMJS2]|uniref:glutathione S-transferase family protein n=1 Tax=Halopseudomonas sp. SMJS2 TaxID=3041098 RepID=UPI0024532616|nr:glutathione S-transferase family protein [Halopseudomonas sp. SMJS2]WGK62464.1 glutathione S-transferase family protein [Halopseudomonas sp. SMJS2]